MIPCPRCESPVDETQRSTCPICFAPLKPESLPDSPEAQRRRTPAPYALPGRPGHKPVGEKSAAQAAIHAAGGRVVGPTAGTPGASSSGAEPPAVITGAGDKAPAKPQSGAPHLPGSVTPAKPHYSNPATPGILPPGARVMLTGEIIYDEPDRSMTMSTQAPGANLTPVRPGPGGPPIQPGARNSLPANCGGGARKAVILAGGKNGASHNSETMNAIVSVFGLMIIVLGGFAGRVAMENRAGGAAKSPQERAMAVYRGALAGEWKSIYPLLAFNEQQKEDYPDAASFATAMDKAVGSSDEIKTTFQAMHTHVVDPSVKESDQLNSRHVIVTTSAFWKENGVKTPITGVAFMVKIYGVWKLYMPPGKGKEVTDFNTLAKLRQIVEFKPGASPSGGATAEGGDTSGGSRGSGGADTSGGSRGSGGGDTSGGSRGSGGADTSGRGGSSPSPAGAYSGAGNRPSASPSGGDSGSAADTEPAKPKFDPNNPPTIYERARRAGGATSLQGQGSDNQ